MKQDVTTHAGRYTRTAMILHWLVAGLIIANLLIGLNFETMPKSVLRSWIDVHKSFGITVLGLALLRLLWRLGHRPPPLAQLAPWERRLAHVVHWGFYGLMILLPLTGWLHDSAWKGAPEHPMRLYGVIPWFRFDFIQNLEPATKEYWHTLFGQIHGALAWPAWALLILHLAGAAKHQFLDGHAELQRMGVPLAQRRVNTQ